MKTFFMILLAFGLLANIANITSIGMTFFCLGIFGLNTKVGRTMLIVGGIVAAIGYYILGIPLTA